MARWSNKRFFTIQKSIVLGLMLIIAAVLFMLYPANNKKLISYAQVGTSCTTPGNIKGVCRDRNTTSCGSYYISGYCPGGANIQCCISSIVKCYPPAGTGECHNRSGGNNYSCSGPWSAGYCPGPSDVQCCTAAPTATPIGPCGDSTTPPGSVVSTGVQTSASSIFGNNNASFGPANLVDGIVDPNKYWNSGGPPTGWVELNLGATQTVTGLKLYVRQSPNGVTNTQISTGSTPAPTTVRRTLNCYTSTDQVINVIFNPPLKDTKYIRVTTTSGPSWVAWNEITAYGSAPGKQSSTPGIVFSGNGTASFGQGAASTFGWIAGGLAYPELYPTATNPSTTSYNYLLNRITSAGVAIIDLTTVAGCSNLASCTLPANLPNGVYQAKNNLSLNGYTFPTGKNYIFLVNGDLTILGNIVVPNGSTAFFTSSNDIFIDKNVGTATNLFPLPGGQLQGIYSADRDFNIEGINDCLVGKDKMLNVEGAIITNAFGNGGTFRTKRDICGDNPNYPSLTVRLRLDFLLNSPEILMKRVTTIREVSP